MAINAAPNERVDRYLTRGGVLVHRAVQEIAVLERADDVGERLDLVADGPDQPLKRLPHGGVVVDYKDLALQHRSPPGDCHGNRRARGIGRKSYAPGQETGAWDQDPMDAPLALVR